jgi:penicillin-binding protein 1A
MSIKASLDNSVVGTFLRIIKFLTTFIITASTILLTLMVIGYFYFAYDLPNIQTLKDYKPPVVSEVFADDGLKIGEFWKECRFWLPVEAIPKQVIQAFIASEDARFFEHRGVDVVGIGRAMIENLKAGRVVQGGSTITQQITRSILLSSERKIARKIREAILATRIERNLNKEQILELYLNQIFLGNRAYGIKAAARNYFDKPVNEMTLAEIAMIAGMPTAPTSDSPVHSIENAKERQKYVLSRMYEHALITLKQKEDAAAESLTIHIAGIDKDYNYRFAPFFTEHVRRLVLEKYGEKTLYENGLKIYTTANLAMNQAAQKAVKNGLEILDRRQGYRGAIDFAKDIKTYADKVQKEIESENHSGVIHIPEEPNADEQVAYKTDEFHKAIITGFEDNNINILVGHKDGLIGHRGYKWARAFNTNAAAYDDANYLDNPKTRFKIGDIVLVKKSDKDGEFFLAQKPLVQGALYSMDPETGAVKALVGGYDFAESEFDRTTQALRQPGSSFKPFIYASALDKGYRYTTPILDSPVIYQAGPNQPPWTPKNYGEKFSGVTTFESDLIHSRNVPTVKIANDIGLHYITAYARKLGITTPIGKYLSMALGSNGVYLSEMVASYSTFANSGIKPQPYYITKVTDASGNILEEYSPPKTEKSDGNASDGTASKNLNTALFGEAAKYIESDGLVLTQEEMKILYGDAIPAGYTVSPQTAYLMTKLLMGVVERGTGTKVRALEKPVAGKTGTTNDETDCWFIGFTPNLAAGVWVGFDNIARIGSKETGGKVSAPIFLEYMKEATHDKPVAEFKAPKGLEDERIASITGGSAIYFKGYSLLREGFESERRLQDRAIDFFEEDLAESPKSGALTPPPAATSGEEDDLAY